MTVAVVVVVGAATASIVRVLLEVFFRRLARESEGSALRAVFCPMANRAFTVVTRRAVSIARICRRGREPAGDSNKESGRENYEEAAKPRTG